MKTHITLALLLLVLPGITLAQSSAPPKTQQQAPAQTQPPPAAQRQEPVHNGSWWVTQSAGFKVGFANGYSMAMADAAEAAIYRCLAAANGGAIPDKYPGDEAVAACERTPEIASLAFGNLRIKQLVDGVDEFYEDAGNKAILAGLAMHYVRDQLRGATDKELADELTLLRRATAN